MCENKSKVYISYKNINFPISYSSENIDFALNYEPLDSDIILVTYPKCGTTWTQQILYLILNDGIPEENKNYVNNTCIEYKGIECKRSPIMKTHLPFNALPYNKCTKYIYVVRNPKDTCLSYYNHMKMRFNYDFHHFFEHFIAGQLPYGNYFEHLKSFWSHRFDTNFCFLFYEQMKDNTRDSVIKISQFLGQPFVDKLRDQNQFIINDILKYSTVDYMRHDLSSNQYIVRKGVVGEWRECFTQRESQLIDEQFDKYFAGTELQSIWAQVMKW